MKSDILGEYHGSTGTTTTPPSHGMNLSLGPHNQQPISLAVSLDENEYWFTYIYIYIIYIWFYLYIYLFLLKQKLYTQEETKWNFEKILYIFYFKGLVPKIL